MTPADRWLLLLSSLDLNYCYLDQLFQALQWNNGTRMPIKGTFVSEGTLPEVGIVSTIRGLLSAFFVPLDSLFHLHNLDLLLTHLRVQLGR